MPAAPAAARTPPRGQLGRSRQARTVRRRRVAALRARGYSIRQIAQRLQVAVSTVDGDLEALGLRGDGRERALAAPAEGEGVPRGVLPPGAPTTAEALAGRVGELVEAYGARVRAEYEGRLATLGRRHAQELAALRALAERQRRDLEARLATQQQRAEELQDRVAFAERRAEAVAETLRALEQRLPSAALVRVGLPQPAV